MNRQLLQAFLTNDLPSRVIEGMPDMDVEIAALIDTPQQLSHHPEGSAYTHTLMVCDYAAQISMREELGAFENAVLRLAALTHDFGKPATTVVYSDGRVTAHSHPEKGVQPALDFLRRNRVSQVVIDNVLPLVREHMAHVSFYTPDITTRTVKRLMSRLEPTNIRMLGYIVEADASGRGGEFYGQGMPARMKEIIDVANNIDTIIRPDPIVDGETIMQVLGIEPSPLLGKVKAALYQAQLDGKFTDLAGGIDFLRHNIRIEKS